MSAAYQLPPGVHRWLCWVPGVEDGRRPIAIKVEVEARTWVLAREQAAPILGVEPGQITVELLPAGDG